jgi:hypothetical protein
MITFVRCEKFGFLLNGGPEPESLSNNSLDKYYTAVVQYIMSCDSAQMTHSAGSNFAIKNHDKFKTEFRKYFMVLI